MYKCKQGENETVKAFNSRFKALERQYRESTENRRGIYDQAGVRETYLTNLLLHDVARQVVDIESLENMMIIAEQKSERLHQLHYLRHHEGEWMKPNKAEALELKDEGETVRSISKANHEKSYATPKHESIGNTGSRFTKPEPKSIIKPQELVTKTDIDKLANDLNNLKIFVNKGGIQTTRVAGQAMTRYSGEARDPSTVKCYNCNNLGHHALELQRSQDLVDDANRGGIGQQLRPQRFPRSLLSLWIH